MLRKKTDWESLIIFQNVCNRVSFSRVTSLQFSGCNFTIKRNHHKFFLQYIPKTSCLRKEYFEKKLYAGPAS